MTTDKKTALITGASKGLGKELALACAKKQYNLILVALPQSNIQGLADQIIEDYGVEVETYEYDLTDEYKIYELAEHVCKKGPLDILINNAGCGGTGEFERSPVEYIDLVLKLNIRATSMLTRLLMPALKASGRRSYVMNISSMAAFCPIGYKHVYPASKVFLYFLTQGLREEYRYAGISFSSVHPGPMLTNLATSRRIIRQGLLARCCLLSTCKIAAISLRLTLEGKSIIIPGAGNKISYWLMKLLPSGMVKRLATKGVRRELQPGVFGVNYPAI